MAPTASKNSAQFSLNLAVPIELKRKHKRLQSEHAELEAEKSRIETHRDALKDGQAEQNRQLEQIVSERDRLREKVDDLEDENDRLVERRRTAARTTSGRSWRPAISPSGWERSGPMSYPLTKEWSTITIP